MKITQWLDLRFERSPHNHHRVVYYPYGDLDFIEFNIPICSLATGPLGVVFILVNGSVRILTGDPADAINTWAVTELEMSTG